MIRVHVGALKVLENQIPKPTLSVCLFTVCLSICQSVCMSVCPSVCQSVCLTNCLQFDFYTGHDGANQNKNNNTNRFELTVCRLFCSMEFGCQTATRSQGLIYYR